jgi:hypothetical protein
MQWVLRRASSYEDAMEPHPGESLDDRIDLLELLDESLHCSKYLFPLLEVGIANMITSARMFDLNGATLPEEDGADICVKA